MAKMCTNCGETKEDSEFYKYRRKCKVCLSAIAKVYYQVNSEYIKAYNKGRYNANKEAVLVKRKEHYNANKEAVAAKQKEHYNANKEAVAAKQKEYYEAEKETILARQRERYEAEKETILARQRRYRESNKEAIAARQKEYYEANKSKYLANGAKRRAYKRKATPSWSNLTAIKAIYELREIISEVTGVLHHVDHIHPLQSDVVCGLHVVENLRIIPAKENLSKSNKFIEGGV